ncbi:2-dehydro-3-deoxy-D-gluconate 5-dehydrogenase (plasmid) [Ensifer sp. WSM1721]|uniref:SDR family NAD(P)-dependent oxidoreductase n=1 Tax=Ensifer sp. WSM1721 TaxID=1041159 RepID=UPI000478E1AB|nr:glucose 1-dehydrogenase [Ensifer sp. WSM1721]
MSTMELFNLAGKVALVTGGARGIGFEFASALAEAGSDVAIADINKELATTSALSLANATGRRIIAINADVSDEADAQRMVDSVVQEFGGIDICFANAGIAEPDLPIRDIEDYRSDYWHRLIAVNLSGVYFTNMAAARAMRHRGKGSIINTASIVGLTADSQWGCVGYTAAKGGVVQLTRQLGVMLAGDGIRVNAIAPGYVLTGLSEAESETEDPLVLRLQNEVLARTPMKRYAQPSELRGIAVFLASEASSYCTGYTYAVDGGWLAA